jgi:prepilin-type N-terminal cleavage/methylation domain-containing protein
LGKKGFSLVELLSVLAVVSVFLSFSSPSIKLQRNIYYINAYSGQVAALVRMCQQKALSEETLYKVTFVSKNAAAPAKVAASRFEFGAYKEISEIVMPPNINISGAAFIIGSTGLPSPGGFGTVQITSGSKSKHIIMSSAGRVRIQ